jgi:DnaK suppressor protein
MTEDEAREALAQEHHRLGAALEAIGQGGALEGSPGGPIDEPLAVGQQAADLGAETAAREVDLSLLEQVRSELDDVDRALERLDDGTYGRCEACGGPIGGQRLAALPAARYCLAHQEAAEAAGPPGSAEGGQP